MINQEKFRFSERYLENRVAEKSTVLYKKGRKIRYYGKIEQTPENIIRELDFNKFKNLEISTLKLFTDYPEKMLEWDIRDEYELHNFLKKILKNCEKIDLNFGKMPTLKFGNPNREMQMLDLLIELAPVSLDELVSAYEEKYGVKKETILANYINCISEYLQNGMYSIEYKDLTWEEQQYLRRKLMEDIYYIDEIKEIYLDRFPNKDSSIINSYNLKKLGYKIYYNMVLSNKYSNLEQYYKKVLKSKDTIDLNSEYIKGRHTSSFYRVFNILKNEFQIFEYLPNKIISLQKLNIYGIELNDLKEYIENVHNFNTEELFTIKSLKKWGFKDKIEDLGFEEWFYASVLSSDSRFKFRKTNNTILFGKEKVTVGDFVKYVVVSNTGINIYKLQDYLFQYYEIKIEKYKLIENIKEKNLYYDQIMETTYIDYNKYLEIN
ncbi:hypothetical protein EII29_09055 [Leptotrichia sp. OH3620_COT-345]|uniref:hypothetical protein n=1 Tax=Leptotrichia sp. OH3620_COT-345 TaxID=2491048 RepID=UPI000F645C1B|nr:hypothetical protein [Leptotrichia sp. OH3620_COT-345]RRD38934.1 hypothetical protein EII29_09055 [Leptotrichia sp. OH3620_COT-345]